MRLIIILIICLLQFCTRPACKISPADLTCEYLLDPPVTDVPEPRLSWVNEPGPDARGQRQTAWEIRVAGSPGLLLAGRADLWNSGRIVSDQSCNIHYKGKPLKSRQTCFWQVRVWDRDGNVSGWSKPASWSMGLLDQSEWKAKWIGAPWQGEEPLPKPSGPGAKLPDLLPPPAPEFRKEFEVSKQVARAVTYVTGLGYFELYLNGKKVGDDVLVPNQTNYGKRPYLNKENIPLEDNFKGYKVFYLAYDVTGSLRQGKNAIGALVGNGFYNPAKYWAGGYGTPRFILQMHISYTDGSEDVIVTDETWKAARSPILMDMVFYGEHYDARLEQDGWCEPGFNDSGWENAVLRKAPEGALRAHMAYPDRVMEILKPVKLEKLSEGRFKVDFGQEISGWVHITGLTGEKGRKIEIRYLHDYVPSGDNTYILKGSRNESYRARFNWFVFREAEILNWPGDLTAEQISAEAVYTKVETTGSFRCSNQLFEDINRIWWRSQTDNMHGGVASDCPNRERSPYTGDGQVACVTVMHNFDARTFYNKWIHDIIDAQDTVSGYVPNGAPWQPGCGGGVAWGAAISIMPWEFYVHYGDTAILKESYSGMKGYVNYMLKFTNSEGIMHSRSAGAGSRPNPWMNLGEWSPPYEFPPEEMVHTFYLWRCADITGRVASVLGNENESLAYHSIAGKTRQAFMTHFWDETAGSYGKYGGNIFALRMGVPEDKKARVLKALASDIMANDGHLDTGIFGTRFFFEVLAENGLNELACEAMNKRTVPSYGYWIEKGATTSWEEWGRGVSGNHPMFGGGLTWLYRNLAGFKSDEANPGYRHIIFRPRPAGDINEVSYYNKTPLGKGGISWKRKGPKFSMDITVPAGATATVYIPAADPDSVTESGTPLDKAAGITMAEPQAGYAVCKTESGNYRFESDLR